MTRDRSFSKGVRAGAVVAVLAIAAGSCGGHTGAEKPAALAAPASAGSTEIDAGAAAAPRPSAPEPPPRTSAFAQPLPVAPPPIAGSSKVTTKHDPAWRACHRSVKGHDKDPVRDVSAIASACAKATRMKAVGPVTTGKQSDAGDPDSFPLAVKRNHCYRVYAQGEAAIQDLDVAIQDSTGAVAGEDANDTPRAVTLEDGAVCFLEDDAARVVVSVGRGGGAYAFQVWGD